MPCLQLHYKHSDNRGPQVRWEIKTAKFLYNNLCLVLFILTERYLSCKTESLTLSYFHLFRCIVFKDFSGFSLSFQGSQGRLSAVPQKAELQIKLSPVLCELDISIVDRLNSLLQPQKLTTVEMMASHMYASYNKHINLVS